jgi:predicted cobalt transporter CbtA
MYFAEAAHIRSKLMLGVSVAFLLIGLFAMIAGIANWLGISFEVGRAGFFIFQALAFLTLVKALLSGQFGVTWSNQSRST